VGRRLLWTDRWRWGSERGCHTPRGGVFIAESARVLRNGGPGSRRLWRARAPMLRCAVYVSRRRGSRAHGGTPHPLQPLPPTTSPQGYDAARIPLLASLVCLTNSRNLFRYMYYKCIACRPIYNIRIYMYVSKYAYLLASKKNMHTYLFKKCISKEYPKTNDNSPTRSMA
jgi:hypothetical protein